MEITPKTEANKVVYIDEYPELAKKVWLRRLAESRLGQLALFPEDPGQLLLFPDQEDTPDGAA